MLIPNVRNPVDKFVAPGMAKSVAVSVIYGGSPARTHALGANPNIPFVRFHSQTTTIHSYPQLATMMEPSNFLKSNRTLSASSLKDRLSKLSVTPLRPVAALQARVECVHSTLSWVFSVKYVLPSMPPASSRRAFLGSAVSRPSRSRYGPT
jgi:hypothetical protein